MAGRPPRHPEGNPAPEYQAVIDQMVALATATPDDDPQVNLGRLHGLWHIADIATNVLRMGMANVNRPGPGKCTYAMQQDLLGKHTATIKDDVNIGRELLREAGLPYPPYGRGNRRFGTDLGEDTRESA